MLNCREVEEQVVETMQAESGAQMWSTHKCKKTYYAEARDGSIHAIAFDLLIVPSLKLDLIGGRGVTNGLDSRVILDKNSMICGIYPRIAGISPGKLCGVELSNPFISDDL